jgi:excinuclease ABC subunit B
VYLYADQITRSMQAAIEETEKRRTLQQAYNKKHRITPSSIKKSIQDIMASVYEADYVTVPVARDPQEDYLDPRKLPAYLKKLKKEMKAAAKRLDFEEAAELRDKIKELEEKELLWK